MGLVLASSSSSDEHLVEFWDSEMCKGVGTGFHSALLREGLELSLSCNKEQYTLTYTVNSQQFYTIRSISHKF
jgi:hypothetical protein